MAEVWQGTSLNANPAKQSATKMNKTSPFQSQKKTPVDRGIQRPYPPYPGWPLDTELFATHTWMGL